MRAACLLSLFLLAGAARAEDPIDAGLLKLFEARVYREPSGLVLPYRLFKPANYDPGHKYPIVLFLHGAVGAGEDNRLQFNGGNEVPPKALTTLEAQAKFPCFILAPQCPRHEGWASLTTRPTQPMRMSLVVLSALQKEFSIDPDRLYVIGLSMGGHGVWDVVSRHPDLFAAAVPICSAGEVSKAPLLIHLPIWCFHGGADPLVNVRYAREMIAALKKAGGNPKYTEYPGVGHNSYVNAFKEPELLPWLFAQKRGTATGATAFAK